MFAHDIENFACVQRLYDVVLASHPLMIVYLVCACILAHRDELEENVDEYQSSVCFFVFKSPLLKLSNLEQLERIIEQAAELAQELPIGVLLAEAKAKDNDIKLTERPGSPFT